MKKRTVLREQAQEFAESMSDAAKMQFALIRQKLEEDGHLVSLYGEKVEGHDELFAMRFDRGKTRDSSIATQLAISCGCCRGLRRRRRRHRQRKSARR